eukprot:s775_g9.t1
MTLSNQKEVEKSSDVLCHLINLREIVASCGSSVGYNLENSIDVEHIRFAGVLFGMQPKRTVRAHDSESSGSASTLTGWVLHVNEQLGDSLADSHSGKETIPSGQSGQSEQSDHTGQSEQSEHTGQSGQSGSDEERNSPDPHEPRSSESTSAESRPAHVPDPVGLRPVGLQSPPRDPSHSNEDDHRKDPCLFHSYHESGCLKGDRCEYSHLIHADQVQAPEAKTRRGHARNRIKRRVAYRLNTPDLYSVHHELQKEVQQDSYAKELIRKHLRGASSSSHVWL